jgi:hypothetical protein
MERRKLDLRPLTKRDKKTEPIGLVMWGEIFAIALFLAGIILCVIDKMGFHIC